MEQKAYGIQYVQRPSYNAQHVVITDLGCPNLINYRHREVL